MLLRHDITTWASKIFSKNYSLYFISLLEECMGVESMPFLALSPSNKFE
jgi:hypothetical protein